jgi:HTH-type transcriptional regulator/antitoxin HigA
VADSDRNAAQKRARTADAYLELVQRFPLRHLKTDRELTAAIDVLKTLLVRGDLAPGEQDYLDVLTDLVERYEEKANPMPAVSDAAMLRHLLDARGITQVELSSEVGIAMSTISEVLHGKRELNRKQIASLSQFFKVDPSVFLA